MGFEQIIGYEEEKKELKQLKGMLRNIDFYRKNGVRVPHGIILCGEPGVGKTVMARALAEDEGIRLVELRAADCCRDNTEEEVRKAFAMAKEQAPSVLLLDEIDKLAGTSRHFFMQENDNVKKILLQELDGLTAEDVVLVAATCNDRTALGDALIRPGRFDHVLDIDLPDEKTRKMILDHYFSKLSMKKDLDTEFIAKLTKEYSGARLECLANETGIYALDHQKESISSDDVVTVINRMMFNGTVRNVTENRKELRHVAVHEAGHALVGMLLKPDRICMASIIHQGKILGHVKMMDDDEMLESVDDALDDICIALGGFVAERVVFGKNYTGAGQDLLEAGQELCNLVVMFGICGYRYMPLMSQISVSPSSASYPPEFLTAFEEQMNALDQKAEKLIRENRDLLEKITDELMEKSAVGREELLRFREELKTA